MSPLTRHMLYGHAARGFDAPRWRDDAMDGKWFLTRGLPRVSTGQPTQQLEKWLMRTRRSDDEPRSAATLSPRSDWMLPIGRPIPVVRAWLLRLAHSGMAPRIHPAAE